MAKDPSMRSFNLRVSQSTVDDFAWYRIPDSALPGGTGGRNVDRVYCTYQIGYGPTETGAGVVDSAIWVAIGVTVGDPPPVPSGSPFSPGGTTEVIYREIAKMLTPIGTAAMYGPPLGEIDAKSKRGFGPAPESAAVWFGLQNADTVNFGVGTVMIVRACGYVVLLVP